MEKTATVIPPWKGYQKIGFRFVFIFFILFILLLDWSSNPIFTNLYYYGHLSTLLDKAIAWIAEDIFGISYVIISPYDAEHNDRTYIYLLYVLIAIIAAVGTLIWSLLHKKKVSYDNLYYWLAVIIRYYLAFTMFLFALYKFFKLQFPDLGYYTLTTQVGDMSPMHLAWAFFGYSYGYNMFMGIIECAGLLLLFRRTTTFGALLTMAALANVIVVNYSFDVHAKMYPTILFIMALFLILKDIPKLFSFFFTGQSTVLSAAKAPIIQNKKLRILKLISKALVISYLLISHVTDNISYRELAEERLKHISEYSGIYDVQSFVNGTDTLAIGHPSRWQQLIIGDRMLEAVRFKGDSIAFASVNMDKHRILVSDDLKNLQTNIQLIYNEFGATDDTFLNMDSLLIDRQLVSNFKFELSDALTLNLKGTIKEDSIFIRAKRRPIHIDDFRLIKRRFHWINEVNYFY